MDKLTPILERFKEPSSWAGIASLLTMIGVQLNASQIDSIELVGAGIVAAILAFAIPETKKV